MNGESNPELNLTFLDGRVECYRYTIHAREEILNARELLDVADLSTELEMSSLSIGERAGSRALRIQSYGPT